MRARTTENQVPDSRGEPLLGAHHRAPAPRGEDRPLRAGGLRSDAGEESLRRRRLGRAHASALKHMMLAVSLCRKFFALKLGQAFVFGTCGVENQALELTSSCILHLCGVEFK